MTLQTTAPPVAMLELKANSTHRRRSQMALQDLAGGFALYRLALKLGWLDIKLRYRGSVLGPFWLTLSTAVMVLSMGVLYAELFHMDLRQYLPYLALSLVLWNALGSMVAEACLCFTGAEATIRSMRMPFTVHAIRALVRNALILGHNAVVIVLVFAYFNSWPHATVWVSLVGLAIWVVDGIAVCLLLGAFCARFRDVPPIIGSVMQIAFFLTPIIWQPEALGSAIPYLVLNPFYSLMAIVRDPMMNNLPGGLIWTGGDRVERPALAHRRRGVRPGPRPPRVLDLTMAAIVVQDLAIDFPIYHGEARSLKKMMLKTASGRFAEDRQHRVVIQALRDISFRLKPGDRLALVGGNGAGKTTLLRSLAGIYEPQQGSVRIEGRLSALLDVSLGMNGEMSGRENIGLRGLNDGMSRAGIQRMEEEVAAFAELGEFIELPVKLYSTGMTLRLAFALATSVHPEVLLMDEWIMAGDAEFQAKARARVEAFVDHAEIVVISTHDTGIVRRWANRVIWLQGGRVVADGAPDEVLERYLGHPLEPLEAEPTDSLIQASPLPTGEGSSDTAAEPARATPRPRPAAVAPPPAPPRSRARPPAPTRRPAPSPGPGWAGAPGWPRRPAARAA